MDIQQILKLKLRSWRAEDKVLWHYDNHGEYSSWSGYRLALQLRDSVCIYRGLVYNWKAVWGLEVPAQVWIFL